MRLQRVVINSRGPSSLRSPAFPFTREHCDSPSSIQAINGEYTAPPQLLVLARVRSLPRARTRLVPARKEIGLDTLPAEGLEPTRSCKDCHTERSRGISGFFLRHTNKIAPSIHAGHSPLNAQCLDKMELGDVSLSLPSIVNRCGIARISSVPLNSSERKALEASAEVVKRNIATLAQTIPI
jgi:hypothetical protein